jgi:hypothetical protein
MRPDRMLGDHRRKAVAAIGDFGHRASLPAASLPSYPVTLTKSPRRRATASSTRRSGGAKLILRRQLGDRRLVAVTPPAPPSPSTRYQAAALSSCSSVCSSSLSGADFTLTPGPILEVPVWRLKCKAVADRLQEVGGWLFTFTRLPHSQWKSVHTKKRSAAPRGVQAPHQDPVGPAFAETTAMAVLALLAACQITTRKVKDGGTLRPKLTDTPVDLAT